MKKICVLLLIMSMLLAGACNGKEQQTDSDWSKSSETSSKNTKTPSKSTKTPSKRDKTPSKSEESPSASAASPPKSAEVPASDPGELVLSREVYGDISLPEINEALLPGAGAARVNKELAALWDELVEDAENFDDSVSGAPAWASYEWAEYNGVLSLMVDYDYSTYGSWVGPFVSWNIDTQTGKILSPEEVFKRAGYTAGDVFQKVTDERNANWLYLEDMMHFSEWEGNSMEDPLSRIFVDESNNFRQAWNAGEVAAFWDDDGIRARYLAISIAGSGFYPTNIWLGKDSREMALKNKPNGALLSIVLSPDEAEIKAARPVDKIYESDEELAPYQRGFPRSQILLTALTDNVYVRLHHIYENPLYENRPGYDFEYYIADEVYTWEPKAQGESLYLEATTEFSLERMVMLYVWTEPGYAGGEYYFIPSDSGHGNLTFEYAGAESSPDDFGLNLIPVAD